MARAGQCLLREPGPGACPLWRRIRPCAPPNLPQTLWIHIDGMPVLPEAPMRTGADGFLLILSSLLSLSLCGDYLSSSVCAPL